MYSLLAAVCLTGINIESQQLQVELDPTLHQAKVLARIALAGEGPLIVQLTNHAEVSAIELDGVPVTPQQEQPDDAPLNRYHLRIPAGAELLVFEYVATFEQDVAAGERPGQIHNFSVDAHVGEDGLFLSDGSAWHPQPLNEQGRRSLHPIAVTVAPLDGWALVASGDPADHLPLDQPCWRWRSPRPLDGLALAANRHQLAGRRAETAFGAVEIVTHLSQRHQAMAPMLLDAAARYLDLYTPLLGAFPYQRFTIVENFFSSGFAYPGFTVIGANVLDRGDLILRPGLLDHELVHNWWGNGVYVDPEDGNWCEALTTYCANYYRRIADDGEDAGREYRMATLMKLSADPDTLDDGPLADFGSADPERGRVHRFVGYDKGAFVFTMLEHGDPHHEETIDRTRIWAALRRFAGDNLGRRAGWEELQNAFQKEYHRSLVLFFDRWVHQHLVPMTPTSTRQRDWASFIARYVTEQPVRVVHGQDEHGSWIEVDPDFFLYRALPPEQIVPLIGGTMGPGACRAVARSDRPEVTAYLRQIESDPHGENLLIIGADAVAEYAKLIARASDPITVEPASFTVGDTTYAEPDQAVMHTMQHPDRPGRFITVFHSNGDPGWAKLRLIGFYRRDTTVIWEDGEVLQRRIFQPDRRIYMPSGQRPLVP